ncbi:hypothetical protein [Streptosporangium minutum]|uniref:hypothetical protein n=1 Tax=Streptosporangium minutum TaxID=569862 RepID=UPI0013FDEC73|nr:hypothetical protein [Streptosporangium minutum]
MVVQPGQGFGAAESVHEHRKHRVAEHASQAGGGPYDRTGDPELLTATLHVGELIDRP